MPAEQAFPLFVDWVIRQEYRKEDWWPKDLEARVQALELLAPYCIGTWTIADAGYVDFGYEVITADIPCAFSTATLDNDFDLSSIQAVGSYGNICFSPDGMKLYAADTAGGTLPQGVSQFNLTTPFDVSTCTFISHKAEGGGLPGGGGFPLSVYVSPDGDKIYFIDAAYGGSFSQSSFVEYTMSTPWDISTLSSSETAFKTVESDVAAPFGMVFSRDGTHIFTGENVSLVAKVHHWTLSTAWDITTATYAESIDLTTLPGFPASWYLVLAFSIDSAGEYMVVPTTGYSSVLLLRMSTPYDLSTMSYVRLITTGSTSYMTGLFIDEECGTLVIHDPTKKKFQAYAIT